jgi:hypothetical protein
MIECLSGETLIPVVWVENLSKEGNSFNVF